MANGNVESGVKEVNIQLRKTKLGLEARIKKILPAKHAAVEWMLEHAAFVLTRDPVHADGKTCYERATGRRWHGKLLEFGEQVMAKLTTPKSRSRMAKKTQAKWIRSTWVGITEGTGEH